MPKEIKITINPDGSSQTDFSGFLGKACLVEAEKLRQALASLGIVTSQVSFQGKPELEQEHHQTEYQSDRAHQAE